MHKTDFANQAPRCCHLKQNGDTCRAAARRGARYCVFHENAHFPRPDYEIPFVEDGASLLHAVSQVIRALHDKALDTKTAAVTLYALQIASGALKRYSAEQQAIDCAHEAAHQKSLAQYLIDQLDLEPEEESAANAAEDARFRAEDDARHAKLNPSHVAQPPSAVREKIHSEGASTPASSSAGANAPSRSSVIPEIKACADSAFSVPLRPLRWVFPRDARQGARAPTTSDIQRRPLRPAPPRAYPVRL